jgi:lipoprotein NlpD
MSLLITGCGGFVYHRVSPGETLYSISWRYGVDYREMARWNHIQAPYTIYKGQLLRVAPPSNKHQTTASVTPPHGGAHVVNPPVASANRAQPAVSTAAAIKWQWPAQGAVVQTFSRSDLGRKGIDIGGRSGEPVRAAAAGSVVYAGSGLLNYGKLVIIKHDDNYLSAYAYNRSILVKEGENVRGGQHVADMGNKADGNPVLHFEIRYDGKPVNPLKYLPQPRQ